MKKILMTSFIVGSFGLAHAANIFVGGLIGCENADAKVKVYNNINDAEAIDSADQDNSVLGLKAGYVFNSNHRADVTFEKTNHRSGLVMIPFSLNYTYITNWRVFNTKPFVGAGAGIIKWSETIICEPDSSKLDFNGRMWQVRAGTAYEASPNVELQIFYRYRKACFDGKSCDVSGNDINVDLDDVHTNGIFFGVNYIF